MEILKSINELKKLKRKQLFYVVSNGEIKSYLYCGVNPAVSNLVIATRVGDYRNVRCFGADDFVKSRTFLKGSYVSKEIGTIMISQLKEKIEYITATRLESFL